MLRKITHQLTPILAVFTCTFFFYRDFGSRMIYGYAVLGALLALHMFFRLRTDAPLRQTPVWPPSPPRSRRPWA